jgi:hypothetical protein
MPKSGIMWLIIFSALAAALLFIPYVEYFHLPDGIPDATLESGFVRLIDNMIPAHDGTSYGAWWYSLTPWWLSLTPVTPFVLIAESTLMSENKRLYHRAVFIFQSVVFILFGVLTYGGMSIILVPHHYLMTYYLIILHSMIIIIWSILLAIPLFDTNKLINNTFRNLALHNRSHTKVVG